MTEAHGQDIVNKSDYQEHGMTNFHDEDIPEKLNDEEEDTTDANGQGVPDNADGQEDDFRTLSDIRMQYNSWPSVADILFDVACKDEEALAEELASQKIILNMIDEAPGDDWKDIQSRVMQRIHILEALVEFRATE
jgi:hypothetical protein